jgi:hypothetical protein
VRFNLNSDTPLPPDEPYQENPPDGAAIDYYLAGNARNVELEIRDSSGRVVRTYRNTDKLPEIKDIGNWPAYWLRRPQALSATAGAHRFFWDMHYQPVPGVPPDYPISANYMNTAPVPTSPWAHPGKYKAVLRVDGKEYAQNFEIRMDPRVRATDDDLKKQFDLSLALYELRMRFEPANAQVAGLATQLNAAKKTASPAVASQIDAFLAKLASVTGERGGGRRGGGGGGGQLAFGINDRIAQIFGTLQEGDYAPTTVTETAARDLIKQGGDTLAAWDALLKNDLPQMRNVFKQNGLPELKLVAMELKHRYPMDKDEGDDDPRTEP